jgi:hypothetical protein
MRKKTITLLFTTITLLTFAQNTANKFPFLDTLERRLEKNQMGIYTFTAFTPKTLLPVCEVVRGNGSAKSLSVQFLGLTFHPGGGAVNMVKKYPLRMDKKATFVINLGFTVAYDYDISDKWFIRTMVGYFKDCAFMNAGFIHMGFRWKPIRIGRHSINGGLGPFLSVRKDWHPFDGYNDKSDFYGKRVWNGMQYRLFPFGGEIEYQYKINRKWDFQYSVVPGFPAVINSRFGFRMKLIAPNGK